MTHQTNALDREQIAAIIQKQFGPVLRLIRRPSYQNPYPEVIDRMYEFLKGFKFPDFTFFSRETILSTLEHIARFMVQSGVASNNDSSS